MRESSTLCGGTGHSEPLCSADDSQAESKTQLTREIGTMASTGMSCTHALEISKAVPDQQLPEHIHSVAKHIRLCWSRQAKVPTVTPDYLSLP